MFCFDRGCFRESPGHSGLRTHPWAVMAIRWTLRGTLASVEDVSAARREANPQDKGTRKRGRRRVR
jgi:hypothetical protein